MPKKPTTQKQLLLELEDLRARLNEAEETLCAIRSGETDALIVSGVDGERLFTLEGTDHFYRILIENINDGALTLTADGLILYTNRHFAEMLKIPLEKVIGATIYTWIAPVDQNILRSMLTKAANEKSRNQLTFTASDGTQVPVDLSVNSLPTNDEFNSFCLVATDLTEQKRVDAIVASEKLAKSMLEAADQANLELLNRIEERKLAEDALRESENRFDQVTKASREMIWEVNADGLYIHISSIVEEILGYKVEEVIGKKHFYDLHPAEGRDAFKSAAFEIFNRKEIFSELENIAQAKNGRIVTLSTNGLPILDSNGELIGYRGADSDITERKLTEKREQMSKDILSLLNHSGDTQNVIDEILRIIKNQTGFDAIGIRLSEGDDFPYFNTNGFSEDFLSTERYLCARDKRGNLVRDSEGNPIFECMCGNVLCGRTDPTKEFFTDYGSFWSNSTTRLLATTTNKDRQARTRNRCNGEGYESVALVPLRSGEKIIGLLQLNDHRTDRFTLELVRYFEGIGASIGIALDRKNAIEALRNSEDKHRTYVENAPTGIFVADENGKYVDLNETACRMLGYTRDELLELSIPELMSPNAAPNALESFAELKQSGKTHIETILSRKDGTDLNIDLIGVKLSENRFMAFCNDITDRKLAEEIVKSSEEQLRLALQGANLGCWDYYPKTGEAFFDKRWLSMLGYKQGDIEQDVEGWAGIMHPDDSPRVMEKLAAHFKDPKVIYEVEIRLKTKSGNYKWILAKGEVLVRDKDGDPIRMAGTHMDITERKLAEEAERKERGKAQSYLNIAPVMFVALSNNGEVTMINRKGCEILGYDDEEILRKNWFDNFLPEPSRDVVMSVFDALIAGEIESTKYYENSVLTKDGSERLIAWHNTLMVDDEGNVIGTLGSGEDITERKVAEQALERFKSAVEASSDAVGMSTCEGKHYYQNKAFSEMFGDVGEDPPGSVYVDEKVGREVFMTIMRGDTWIGEIEMYGKGKKLLNILLRAYSIKDENGKILGLVGVHTDITEHKELEEQFRQSQKMEGVGRLAGGVAHDFNNLLTIISGHTDLTLMTLDSRDPIRVDLEEIQKAAQKAAGLTRQLLAFSRKQTLQPKVLNLTDIINNLQKMLKRIIGEDIDLVIKSEKDLWNVEADPGQMEQVIINLLVNARDAMPDGGTLTIETRNEELNEEYAKDHTDATPGPHVRMAVSDTGCGMTDEVKTKVFDPFYTTKEQGKGTGLGLSTVYGIVKQSGGNILIYSEPGIGTSFKIYLPRVSAEAEQLIDDDVISGLPRGTETILLVEDEKGVRRLASQILKQQGYKIIEAENGGEALMICKEREKSVDLVITDVVMPNMNGAVLIKNLQEIWPKFKVLFMSGYTADVIVRSGTLDKDIPYLEKPFRPIDLAWKVRRVLDDH